MIQDAREIVKLVLEGKRVIVLSPLRIDCSIVKEHVRDMLLRMDKQIKVNENSIDVINMGSISFIPITSEYGLRGMQADAIYLDEVAITRDNVQELGVVLR